MPILCLKIKRLFEAPIVQAFINFIWTIFVDIYLPTQFIIRINCSLGKNNWRENFLLFPSDNTIKLLKKEQKYLHLQDFLITFTLAKILLYNKIVEFQEALFLKIVKYNPMSFYKIALFSKDVKLKLPNININFVNSKILEIH